MSLAAQYKKHLMYTPVLHSLMTSGILEERVVEVTYRSKTKKIGGLRCADRSKVLNLDDATLASWVRSGLMEILFAHWQSMGHLSYLVEHADNA